MPKRRVEPFHVLLRDMRSRDAMKAEGAFLVLAKRVRADLPDLLDAFECEQAHGVRCWLLELIGEARDERAFGLLCEHALGADEALRDWAIRGLQQLGTPDARKFLWDAGLPRVSSD